MAAHILIGVLYNRNGIATWCIEAARALLSGGYRVTLISTHPHWVPDDLKPNMWVLPAAPSRGLFQKVKSRLYWWAQFALPAQGNPLPVRKAFFTLKEKGIPPDVLLVAQTDFVWPEAPVPQWVVARTWPATKQGYLEKMKSYPTDPLHKKLHDALYWYKMDHKAYRMATGIFTLTEKLAADLQSQGLPATCLYPCCGVPEANNDLVPREPGIPRLMTAALHLGEARKHIAWMMQGLGDLHRMGHRFELTLAGEYTPALEKAFRLQVPDLQLTGPLNRAALLNEMRQHDIFLFASLQENWGYVLTEAMACGITLITPDIYPFQEINPYKHTRYIPGDKGDFIGKVVDNMHPQSINEGKSVVLALYQKQFSPSAFLNRFRVAQMNKHQIVPAS